MKYAAGDEGWKKDRDYESLVHAAVHRGAGPVLADWLEENAPGAGLHDHLRHADRVELADDGAPVAVFAAGRGRAEVHADSFVTPDGAAVRITRGAIPSPVGGLPAHRLNQTGHPAEWYSSEAHAHAVALKRSRPVPADAPVEYDDDGVWKPRSGDVLGEYDWDVDGENYPQTVYLYSGQVERITGERDEDGDPVTEPVDVHRWQAEDDGSIHAHGPWVEDEDEARRQAEIHVLAHGG